MLEIWIPLYRAIESFCDPTLVKEYCDLMNEGYPCPMFYVGEPYDPKDSRARHLREQLQNDIVEMLHVGVLVAKGMDGDATLLHGLQTIPGDLRRFMTVNFSKNSAVIGSKNISAIQVRLLPDRTGTSTPGIPLSIADAKRWYENRVQELLAEGRISNREEDRTAAQEKFGKRYRQSMFDQLRVEIAPPEWQVRGKRQR